jgi:hypothetical protein
MDLVSMETEEENTCVKKLLKDAGALKTSKCFKFTKIHHRNCLKRDIGAAKFGF